MRVDSGISTKSVFSYVFFTENSVEKKNFGKTRLPHVAPAKTRKPQSFRILPTVTSQKKKVAAVTWFDVFFTSEYFSYTRNEVIDFW